MAKKIKISGKILYYKVVNCYGKKSKILDKKYSQKIW